MVAPRCASVKMIISVRWSRAMALRVSHLTSVGPLTLKSRVLRVVGVGMSRVCRTDVGGGGVTLCCGVCDGVFQGVIGR